MTSDGHQLRETWSNALNDALSAFRTHLTTAQSSSWKRLAVPSKSNSTDNGKVKSRTSVRPDIKDVVVHRKSTKSGDVYRIMFDVAVDEDLVDLEAWKAVITIPELRPEWDPAVESAQILEMLDPATRIVKTNFTLGWPANPRDAVMISRTYYDDCTLVDVSTSLPRSPDEPSYLRPSPPYVRSHVHLFAWCIQLLSPEGRAKRIRMTCFWQHNLKTVWNIGVPTSLPQQSATMVIGLPDIVRSKRSKLPSLTGYGLGVSIERVAFDTGRAALTVDYAVVLEDQDASHSGASVHGLDELNVLKEQRRLQRGLEFLLPSRDGWDIRVITRASSEIVAQLPWKVSASKYDLSKVAFRIQHAPLLDNHSVLKVKLVIEYAAALRGVRVNGLAHALEDRMDRDLKSFAASSQLLKDASSVADVSLDTGSASTTTAESEVSDTSSLRRAPLLRTDSGISVVPRGTAFDKSILARVRRNYIYFSSLLQEPDAKWKRNSDVRGVSVTQLDSIDPTLVVYKAEATFVGIGLWDLFSAIVSPGTRAFWDRQYEDATLLEDVNELTELWHFKTKAAWPVTGRDCILLKTVYKSPTTVHVFSFSVDDSRLFPSIPPVEVGTIRTQVDLQGWAIEALSPTTTQLTLLEQSDPKGWTGKSTVPQQMISAVAGVGEFAIKYGGPPVVTRLSGARSLNQRYDHDRGQFRLEYEPAASRIPSPVSPDSLARTRQDSFDSMQTVASSTTMITPQKSEPATSATIECELRCDIDTWATSLDIVIDPPPQSITCLRRHRLSAGGGGLWLTVGHDIPLNSEERLQAIVRRAPFTTAKEKGLVMVNGKRIQMDVEELPEAEVKSLTKQKRIKPVRVPLDQPPVLGAIRRRRAELDDGESSDSGSDFAAPLLKKRDSSRPGSISSTAPKVPSPLSIFFTSAMEQVTTTTQQAVAALVPPAVPLTDVAFPEGKKPIHFALDALAFAHSYHRGMYRDNWTSVSDTVLMIHKRTSPEISPNVPVHRGEKVIEGVTADDVASVIFSYECRKQWDERLDAVSVLEEYSADCHTAFLVAKTGFPFRDRGLLIASLMARESKSPLPGVSILGSEQSVQSPNGANGAIFCVSASFNPASAGPFNAAKYNPHTLPVGRIFIDAWIVETLDPYTSESYTIPSTRCIRLAAADFAGSVPVAFNSMINASLPRAILSLESYVKNITPFPEMRFPAAGFRLSRDPADDEDYVWKVRPGRTGSILLNGKLHASDKVFSANLLVAFDGSHVYDSSDDEKERDVLEVTPRPRRLTGASRPSSPDQGSRSRPDSTTSVSRRHKRETSVLGSETTSRSLAARSRSGERVRASSSTFSMRRDQKSHRPKDFFVADIVVDMRSYPEGYEVKIASRMESRSNPSRSVQLSRLDNDQFQAGALPIMHSVHLLPPSPLYASGTAIDTPTRHLVRLTLPTAQYQMPAVEDPLTGEVRSAPPKPEWYRDLEGGTKFALTHITVRPLPPDKLRKNKKIVLIGGETVTVGGEREAHKEGIPDEMCASVLSRVTPREGENAFDLPDVLSLPLAVEDTLLNLTAIDTTLPDTSELPESQADASSTTTNVEDEGMTATESPGHVTPVVERELTPPVEAKRGFLGLIDSYQKSLSSFTFRTSTPTEESVRDNRSSPLRPVAVQNQSSGESPLDRISSSAVAVVRQATVPRYSISTVIASILIAFLLGSLLRSLLSPADFIYVVTDLSDVPEGVTRGPNGEVSAIEPGWREIKRLVELKYIVGGWDFQIAVVRRH